MNYKRTEKLFELVKENTIARLHQEISERLDDLIYDDFIEDYFPDPQDKNFEKEVENFFESKDEKKIDKMVDFIQSELSNLELPIWNIIKEESYKEVL